MCFYAVQVILFCILVIATHLNQWQSIKCKPWGIISIWRRKMLKLAYWDLCLCMYDAYTFDACSPEKDSDNTRLMTFFARHLFWSGLNNENEYIWHLEWLRNVGRFATQSFTNNGKSIWMPLILLFISSEPAHNSNCESCLVMRSRKLWCEKVETDTDALHNKRYDPTHTSSKHIVKV